jgi:hypothetical protein
MKTEVKTDSFSAKIVYSNSIPDLMKNFGDRNECVISVDIENKEHKIEVKNIKFMNPLKYF